MTLFDAGKRGNRFTMESLSRISRCQFIAAVSAAALAAAVSGTTSSIYGAPARPWVRSEIGNGRLSLKAWKVIRPTRRIEIVIGQTYVQFHVDVGVFLLQDRFAAVRFWPSPRHEPNRHV
jgi:hypothetical protein